MQRAAASRLVSLVQYRDFPSMADATLRLCCESKPRQQALYIQHCTFKPARLLLPGSYSKALKLYARHIFQGIQVIHHCEQHCKQHTWRQARNHASSSCRQERRYRWCGRHSWLHAQQCSTQLLSKRMRVSCRAWRGSRVTCSLDACCNTCLRRPVS